MLPYLCTSNDVVYAPRFTMADDPSSEGKIPISADEHRVLFGVGHMLELPLSPRPRPRPRGRSLSRDPCLSQLLLLRLRPAGAAGRLQLGATAPPCSCDFLLEKLLLPASPALVLVASVFTHRYRCAGGAAAQVGDVFGGFSLDFAC